MKTAFLLESRRKNWRALEHLCDELQSRRQRRLSAKSIARFATLYRAACADLALADAYQLPAGTVLYLHQLVGRAHNQLYRSGRFQLAAWRDAIFRDLPRQLLADRTLWLAMALFWGIFFATLALAVASPAFVTEVLGDSTKQIEESFSQGLGHRSSDMDTGMAGFYIQHNTTIGLQCFAYGLVFGVGGLLVTAFNAGYIGAVFGHMLTTPQRDTFLDIRHRARPVRADGDRAVLGRRPAAGIFNDPHGRTEPRGVAAGGRPAGPADARRGHRAVLCRRFDRGFFVPLGGAFLDQGGGGAADCGDHFLLHRRARVSTERGPCSSIKRAS